MDWNAFVTWWEANGPTITNFLITSGIVNVVVSWLKTDLPNKAWKVVLTLVVCLVVAIIENLKVLSTEVMWQYGPSVFNAFVTIFSGATVTYHLIFEDSKAEDVVQGKVSFWVALRGLVASIVLWVKSRFSKPVATRK